MIYKPYAKLLVGIYRFGRSDWEQIVTLLDSEHIRTIDEAIAELEQEKASGDRMCIIIKRYYGIGCTKATMEAIGSELDRSVNRERVRQFRSKAERLLLQNRKLRPVAERLHTAGWINERITSTLQLPTDAQVAELQRAASILDAQEKESTFNTIPIESLGLTVRTVQCLHRENVATVAELCKKTNVELLRSPNFGRKSINEVQSRLASYGLQLAEG